MTDQPANLDLDEIAARAAYLDEYATLTDEPLQSTADLLTGTDVPALINAVRRLRGELARQERLHGDTIDDRDRAQDAADKLAYAVAPENVIGEHTADNCPWTNAFELITPAAEVDRLRRERDLAIAHDRQPYPTAWAYEQACKALRRKTEAIERAVEFAASLDQTARQLAGPDAVHPVAARIRHLLDTTGAEDETPATPAP